MKICAAADCSNEVAHSGKYCSARCRYRASKQKIYKERAKNGLCIQCGGEMDSPVSSHRCKVSPKYCSKCQLYFKVRYEVKSSEE